MDATALLRTQRISWSRDELRVELVPSRAHVNTRGGTALRLSRAGCSPGLEIAPLSDDDATSLLIDSIVTGGRAAATTPE